MPFTLGGDWVETPKERPPGPFKIHKERRRQKIVTRITRLPLFDDEIKELAKSLRHSFACGGSVKEGAIELQGDFADKAKELVKDYLRKIQ
ncbi:MAG: translation initiation factor [Simkaniaceae bacterium]|nr:translation initiation factor [Simkaniaceae bacterium]